MARGRRFLTRRVVLNLRADGVSCYHLDAGATLLVRVKIVVVAAAAKPALGSLYDVAGLPDGLANQHRSTGLPGSAKQTTMGLFKSPWRSKVAAVAAFQSPEPPAEEPAPPPPPPPPGRDAATIVEGSRR